MRDYSELERLIAVAEGKAYRGGLRSLRWTSVMLVVVVGCFASEGGTSIQGMSLGTLLVLAAALAISVFAGWRYASLCQEFAWNYCMLAVIVVSFSLGFWLRLILLTAFSIQIVFDVVKGVRTVRRIRLADSPACAAEHETVERWLSELTDEGTSPDIIQFAADDWQSGSVIVRVLQQERWLVVATLLKKDVRKLLTLDIFDARSVKLSYSPERKRFRAGDHRFRSVGFTPELISWANQFTHGSSVE